jgi:microcompartment protein CcmK/EutM
MNLGKVVGTVVATQKDEGLEGYKMLLVQNMTLDLKLKDSYSVAVDTVGAGVGETVVTVGGSSARMTHPTKDRPVDTAVVAIVDYLDVEGQVVYRKEED